MEMSAEDRDRIAAAIRAVEARTTGEIVCVLAEQSADSGALPILLAALAALAPPWLLVAFTTLPVLTILSLAARRLRGAGRCCSACRGCAWR